MATDNNIPYYISCFSFSEQETQRWFFIPFETLNKIPSLLKVNIMFMHF